MIPPATIPSKKPQGKEAIRGRNSGLRLCRCYVPTAVVAPGAFSSISRSRILLSPLFLSLRLPGLAALPSAPPQPWQRLHLQAALPASQMKQSGESC